MVEHQREAQLEVGVLDQLKLLLDGAQPVGADAQVGRGGFDHVDAVVEHAVERGRLLGQRQPAGNERIDQYKRAPRRHFARRRRRRRIVARHTAERIHLVRLAQLLPRPLLHGVHRKRRALRQLGTVRLEHATVAHAVLLVALGDDARQLALKEVAKRPLLGGRRWRCGRRIRGRCFRSRRIRGRRRLSDDLVAAARRVVLGGRRRRCWRHCARLDLGGLLVEPRRLPCNLGWDGRRASCGRRSSRRGARHARRLARAPLQV